MQLPQELLEIQGGQKKIKGRSPEENLQVRGEGTRGAARVNAAKGFNGNKELRILNLPARKAGGGGDMGL